MGIFSKLEEMAATSRLKKMLRTIGDFIVDARSFCSEVAFAIKSLIQQTQGGQN